MRDSSQLLPQVMIIRMPASRLSAQSAGLLSQKAQEAVRSGRMGVLIDLSGVARITHCGLAALVEFFATFSQHLRIGFCQARPKVRSMIEAYGLTRSLPLYASLEDTMAQPEFRRCSLTGTRVVILCAGKGTRMAPLSWDTPKPMLDVFGKPVLEHLITHLERFGVRDIYLNPGHLGGQIIAHFQASHQRNILFSNEGSNSDDGWEGSPVGSASTLRRLHRNNNAFADDFIVMCGDALIDLDFAQMMAQHKSSDAHITIATKTIARHETGKYGIIATNNTGRVAAFQKKPPVNKAVSTMASVGIYIISPSVLETISEMPNQDIAQHLLPTVLKLGGKIQTYQGDFYWHDMGCGRDYARVLEQGLQGKIPNIQITGEQISPGIWVDENVDISNRAQLTGSCYIGAESIVRAGATIEGTCVLGAKCRIETSAQLHSTILHPGTAIKAYSQIAHRFASPFWTIETEKADGRTVNTEPLDNVVRTAHPETHSPRWFGLIKAG
ncbi:sugar phosphate nucleotidyltransferase [Roseovarius sp. EL26]|uniref:sugar phosphate nucleotidyltransferase n=1 Tax=Roseovarius sp. EL26 TaxID=2126672 RepID=UPI000EA08E5A|nr:sugar phosphate nucleotidyltransferase [Roseovarius sp. EL26]